MGINFLTLYFTIYKGNFQDIFCELLRICINLSGEENTKNTKKTQDTGYDKLSKKKNKNKQKQKQVVKASEVKRIKNPWSKKKKIAAGIIGAAILSFVIFMIVVLVMQLGGVHPIKSSEEEARVVGTYGDFEVKYEELKYVTLICKEELDSKYGSYDKLSAEDKEKYNTELEENVLEELKSNYVILTLCKEYGIDTDSSECKKYVNKW